MQNFPGNFIDVRPKSSTPKDPPIKDHIGNYFVCFRISYEIILGHNLQNLSSSYSPKGYSLTPVGSPRSDGVKIWRVKLDREKKARLNQRRPSSVGASLGNHPAKPKSLNFLKSFKRMYKFSPIARWNHRMPIFDTRMPQDRKWKGCQIAHEGW